MFSLHHHPARLAAGLDEGGQPGELGVLGLAASELLGRDHLLLGHLPGRDRVIPLGVDDLVEPRLATPADDRVLGLADECDQLGLRLDVPLGVAEHVLAVLEQLLDAVGLALDHQARRRVLRTALAVNAICPLLPLSPRREPRAIPAVALGHHLHTLPLGDGHANKAVGLRLIGANRNISPTHILHVVGRVRQDTEDCTLLHHRLVLLSGHVGEHLDDKVRLRLHILWPKGLQCVHDLRAVRHLRKVSRPIV